MGDLLTPANIVVLLIVVAALVIGGRRALGGLFRGESCCTDGTTQPTTRTVEAADTDEANYPYRTELLIGGMSCENCARNVESALNALPGTWARVDLAEHTALVLTKEPIDRDACDAAVHDAGYYVMKV